MANDIQGVAFIAVLALVGCGSIDPAQSRCELSLGDEYLPLVGNGEWTYAISDAARDVPLGEKGNKILEENGSTIKLEVSGVLRPGVRWLRAEGSRYEWLRNLYVDPVTRDPVSDQYYEPPALRFDGGHDADASWQEEPYRKTSIEIAKCPGWSESLGSQNVELCPAESITTEQVTETWTVIAVDEMLSDVQRGIEPARSVAGVPAGDFNVRCLQRSCEAEACTSGTYCFSRGVGKVYELSSEREELASVCFPE